MIYRTIFMITLAMVIADRPALGQASQPREEPGSLDQATVLPQHEVPFALRAQSLLSSLSLMQSADEKDGSSTAQTFLSTVGLDPASEAGHHLLEVAREFRDAHPRRKPELGRDGLPIPRNVGLPLKQYEGAGEAFGRWLRAREAEGWAIEPLIDRLLNNPYIGSTYGSTDGDRKSVDQSVSALEQAFHRGLRRELGYLPKHFRR